jgi:threonine dehydratase
MRGGALNRRTETPPLAPSSLDDIRAARQRIAGIAIRTPVVALASATGLARVILKLESLQPIGSFKLRGAASAMALAGRDALVNGVYTASAGNMAQGVAWCARDFGVACRVIMPESAPDTKVAAIRRLGGEVLKVPFDDWWRAMIDHGYPGIDGLFIHPFAGAGVMAGNGTIGLELLEDEPRVNAVLVPWGGGGLACGIASAVRAVAPNVRVYAVELDVAAPLSASFARGEATTIVPTRTYVDGIGGRSVAPEMFALAQTLLAGVLRVTLAQVTAAVRQLAEQNRVVAEGAGAAPVAAAIAGVPDASCIACIVSGGNIDSTRLAAILRGEDP